MTKTIKVSFLAYVNNADMATIKNTEQIEELLGA